MGMAIRAPKYTIEDLDRFPDDGNRYELLDGMLLVTPAPSLRHQWVALELSVRLHAAVRGPGLGHVVSPGVVPKGTRTQLQPDILVYPSRFTTKHTWKTVTEHWLVVEILSPSSRVYDREFKRDAYLKLGVREVWLVDMDAESIEVSRKPGQVNIVSDVLRWRIPGADRIVTIDVQEVLAASD